RVPVSFLIVAADGFQRVLTLVPFGTRSVTRVTVRPAALRTAMRSWRGAAAGTVRLSGRPIECRRLRLMDERGLLSAEVRVVGPPPPPPPAAPCWTLAVPTATAGVAPGCWKVTR